MAGAVSGGAGFVMRFGNRLCTVFWRWTDYLSSPMSYAPLTCTSSMENDMKKMVTGARGAAAGLAVLGSVMVSSGASASGQEPPACYPETCECIMTVNGYYFCWFI